MDNSRRWQRAALEECSEPAPVEPAPAIPPREDQNPQTLAAYHKAEIEKWWPILKAANIKGE